jgi:hypothetical protein
MAAATRVSASTWPPSPTLSLKNACHRDHHLAGIGEQGKCRQPEDDVALDDPPAIPPHVATPTRGVEMAEPPVQLDHYDPSGMPAVVRVEILGAAVHNALLALRRRQVVSARFLVIPDLGR